MSPRNGISESIWFDAINTTIILLVLTVKKAVHEGTNADVESIHNILSDFRHQGQLAIELYPPFSLILRSSISLSSLALVQWLVNYFLIIYIAVTISTLCSSAAFENSIYGVTTTLLGLALEDDSIMPQPTSAITASNALGDVCLVFITGSSLRAITFGASLGSYSPQHSLLVLLGALSLLFGCNTADLVTAMVLVELDLLYNTFEMFSDLNEPLVSLALLIKQSRKTLTWSI